LTDHSQQFTAHLIEPQTLFSLVSGEKAENQKREYYRKSYQARREIFILQIVLFVASLLCVKKKSTRAKPAYQAVHEVFILLLILFAASLLCEKKKKVHLHNPPTKEDEKFSLYK
jgi:uncharacterized membrane protein YtjA (UPF0391 family)